MTIPLYYLLYVFVGFLGGWLFFSTIGMYHIFMYARVNFLSIFFVFVYIAIALMIMYYLFYLLLGINWNIEIPVYSGFGETNNFIPF